MIQELLRRRVPQFLGGYLVAVWGVVQFVSFLESRYTLSHGLVEMVGAGLLLLLPSVAIVAWGHGSPGPDTWNRRERILVPFNLAIAIGLAVFLTRGSDALGTVTETIQVENEEGVIEQRVVPSKRIMSRVTPFFFDNLSGNTDLDWIGSTIPTLLSVTFLQDLSITVTNPYVSFERFREAGHATAMGAPRSLQRQIAEEYHSPYYLLGNYDLQGDTYTLTQELVDGTSHRTMGSQTVSGSDLQALVDQLAEGLRVELGLPEAYRESVVLLPLEEILTSSPDALELFGRSQLDLSLHNDFEDALGKLSRAVELDPQFCLAHFQLYVVGINAGRADLSTPSIEKAMEHIYRVPEGIQFTVKLNYFYQVKQDGEKALAVGRMWTRLYPDDMDAHGAMISLLELAREYDEAIASVEKLRQLDPTRDELFVLAARLYQRKGDYDSALLRLRAYADSNPEDARSFTQLARLMIEFGHLEAAVGELETATLLDPGKVDVMLTRADVEEKLGRTHEADAQLAEAGKAATTAADRMRVEDALQDSRRRRGQITAALTHRAAYYEAAREAMSPIQLAVAKSLDLSTHREAGRLEASLAEQAELAPSLQGPLEPYAALGRGLLASEMGDIETAEAALPAVRVLVEQQRLELARNPWSQTLAQVAEAKGDLDEAILQLTTIADRDRTHTGTRRELARLLREKGDPAAAAKRLEEALRLDPTDPRVHLEMARVRGDQGKFADAVRHVDQALETWKDADPDYFRAIEAKQLRADLQRNL